MIVINYNHAMQKNNELGRKKIKKVLLKQGEIEYLTKIVKRGSDKARMIKRAYILLALNNQKMEKEIQNTYFVSHCCIWTTREKYLKKGIEYALGDKKRNGRPKKYNTNHESELIATACSDPPKGKRKWTLELLRDKMRKDNKSCGGIGKETIRLMLKKTNVNLGQRKCGVSVK
jgi:putative transposase